VDQLDLTDLMQSYELGDGRGQPPYHPAMMVKLLLYAYCVGVPASRKIARGTHRDVAFRVLAGDQHPDHDSIAEFRRRHLDRLAGLFLQVLRLCQAAGLVTLGQVALDGTKVQANASRHKAMSYARMEGTSGDWKARCAGCSTRQIASTPPRTHSMGPAAAAMSCPPNWPAARRAWR